MSDYKVIDKKGAWVYNQGEHRIPDYARQCELGGDLVIIEPGVPTKIDFTESLRANVKLIEIEDPTETDGIVPKAPKEEKAASRGGKAKAEEKPAETEKSAETPAA